MARFFAPILAYHDRREFAITCYAHVARPDAVTEQLKRQADAWRDIAALSDDAAAELIRRDGIDILVDLCGHMPFNRLPLFARRPAPVQVTYLGYPATTGMASMDWRITDSRHDPILNDSVGSAQGTDLLTGEQQADRSALRTLQDSGGGALNEPRPSGSGGGPTDSLTLAARPEHRSESVRGADPTRVAYAGGTDRFHTERLARIEGGCWCYRPDDEGPAVNDLPALSGGASRDREEAVVPAEDRAQTLAARQAPSRPFTFVMFNRLVKVTPAIVRLWTGIVSATPNSRLMFLATERGDLQDSTLELFLREGFPMERLVSVGRRARRQYMELFHRADLALDTFPYAGHTTTCDALWMGVPTVTLAGRTHVSRAGLAVMQSVGLGEFVAGSPDEYVAIATRWANDLPGLRELRAGLRQRMASSPLCDPQRLTRGIESAYREMCEGREDVKT